MLHRLEKLFRNCRLDEPRIGIVSLWDVENNAVQDYQLLFKLLD